MKKIVQLRDYEYNELYEKAKLNEQQIEEKALSLWKEKGVAEIHITVNTNKDWRDEYYIKCFTSLWYKDGKFQIQEDIRSRFEKIIKSAVQNRAKEEFGDPVKYVNRLNKRIYDVSRLKVILYAIAASGWAVASAIAIEIFISR